MGLGAEREDECMSRAPFQVLVYPYQKLEDGTFNYALFRRADQRWWQRIAGGGEDDELPEQAARREAHEEAGIPYARLLIRLTAALIDRLVHHAYILGFTGKSFRYREAIMARGGEGAETVRQ